MLLLACSFIFFFNDTATTEIYTLSLHDALPILRRRACPPARCGRGSSRPRDRRAPTPLPDRDRKSTRLNSSHTVISYAVFCLKKKHSEILLLKLVHVRCSSTFANRLTAQLEVDY